jgi:hypothetical protein
MFENVYTVSPFTVPIEGLKHEMLFEVADVIGLLLFRKVFW